MSNVQKLLSGAVLVGAAFLFLGTGGPTVTADEARTLVKQGAVLLDVRTTGEFAAGHLEGAVNVPVGELKTNLAQVSAKKDQPIVVYCQSGRRSAAARKILEEAGFSRVVDLGAMSNWK
ncbi:MAG: rhodanese-like domain-containing protein [Archangium sp.]|nr:rhodanese-like domain-containing protein [Archangium sp.]MDP3158281.1 rhodanese-like domain-containing protein [Archangium sp.]MDP3569833.1 rhodanese-like domain-containing protein [Archangium sp.]